MFNFGGVPFSIWEREEQMVIGPPVTAGMAELGEGDDVSPFFALLNAQLEFASRFRVEPEQANLWDKVVLEEGCLDEKRVYVERSGVEEAGDSGWFVGVVKMKERGALVGMRVWQLLRIRPSLLRAFALPSGFLVVFDGNEVVSVFDPEGKALLG